MDNDTRSTPAKTPTATPQETTPTPTPKPSTQQLFKTSVNSALLIIAIIFLVATGFIFYRIAYLNREPTNGTYLEKGTPLKDNHVAEMATDICKDEPYITVFQHPEIEKTMIARCDRRNPDNVPGIEEYNVYYSITDRDDPSYGYYKTGRFTYLGEDNVESVEKYLKGQKYIYMRHNTVNKLVLLVEANSETEAVNKVADNVYDFIIRDLAEHPSWELDFITAIYYAKDLSFIEDIKDYIVLTSPYIDYCDYNDEKTFPTSPEGNGFGSYSFICETEMPPTLKYLSDHTELQKEAVKTALSNRHAEYEFKKVSYKEKYDTKEEFRTKLLNSFVDNK